MTHEINDQFNEYFIEWERITPSFKSISFLQF